MVYFDLLHFVEGFIIWEDFWC